MFQKNFFNKKILYFCLSFSLIFSMLAVVRADTNHQGYVFEYGNNEIAISKDIDYQKAEMIADKIEGITNNSISPFGIFCIFGHDIAYATATETQHNYYATSPRCKKSTYTVEYCTRSSCDYCVYTLTGTMGLGCH